MMLAESQYKYIPQGNRILVEVQFEASPLVYTDEKQLVNMIEKEVRVVGIGNNVTKSDCKIGDKVHIGFNSTTRTAIPEQFMNDIEGKPSIKDIIAQVKETLKEKKMNELPKLITSYAWFTVAEFDINGIIRD